MKWRGHLPEDCPPEDAIPTEGIVYRLAERTSFDERDFLSKREEYPNKQWDGVPECIAGGVSLYTEIAGIERLWRLIPAKRRKRKKVIQGNLQAQHGKMKNTPSKLHKSHHTWWIPVDAKPWEEFELIVLKEDKL
jgi:hypothetical protein